MDPIEERDAPELELEIVELGTVSEQTKGSDVGLTIDGGDPPFNRVFCVPC